MNTPRAAAASLAILSMDCISEFKDELWLAPHVDDWRRVGLRILLQEYMTKPYQLMPEAETLYARVHHDLKYRLLWNVWHSIYNWSNLVYGDHGVRRPENDWLDILAGVQHGVQEGLPAGLRPRLIQINEECFAAASRVEDWLASLKEEALSQWDRTIMEQLEVDVQALGGRLEGMIVSNRLVRSWNLLGGFLMTELCQIFEWGRAKLRKNRDIHYEVSFPGSWEYGLIPYDGRLPNVL